LPSVVSGLQSSLSLSLPLPPGPKQNRNMLLAG
jgi:hypothetical protein